MAGKRHKLSVIPIAYVEAEKILDKKSINDEVKRKIDVLDEKRRMADEEAILDILNDNAKGNYPTVKLVQIREKTFKDALGGLLRIKNSETFELMMLLFEYMEKNGTYKLDKLTGTELLKFGKVRSINQQRRHDKLKLLVNQANVKIQILDPEKSLENYQNKKSDKGLVYKFFDLLRIKEITYSKSNPEMIVRLGGIELLPEYAGYMNLVSRRYLPLESIRKIPEEKGKDKSKHFLYKLCFKFASIKQPSVTLTLSECMNLGKFSNETERSIKRKWQPIEKALIDGEKAGLLKYSWNFGEISELDKKKNSFQYNLLGEIVDPRFNDDSTLEDEYYKYIASVFVTRTYELTHSIDLPFELEEEKPEKEKSGVKFSF